VNVLSRRPRLVAAAIAVALVAAAGLLAFRWTRPPASQSLDVTTRLDFRCTLPVIVAGRPATVSIPDGSVSDSHATFGPHDQGDSYAGGRWLPVLPQWVSPDGRSYAYITFTSGPGTQTSTLFVHDVAGGGDRAVWSGPGQAMLDLWAPSGIYWNRMASDRPSNQLWVVDPAHPEGAHAIGPNPPPATPRGSIPPLMLFGQIAGGAAWAVTASHEPAGGSGAIINDELVRMDLRDGSLSTWYQALTGSEIDLLAFDPAGRALVGLAHPAVEVGNVFYPQPVRSLALVTGRGTSSPVPMPEPDLEPIDMSTDAHGTWLTGPGSLLLYRDGRLVKVADVGANVAPPERQPAYPAGVPAPRPGGQLTVVGRCE
jgi:hypothetical protein